MATNTYLEDRYGKSAAPKRKMIVVLAALLLTVFFVWAIAVSFFAPATAKASVLGYQVVNAQSTEVRFTVSKTAKVDAVCEVEVLNNSYAVVGFLEVSVPADAPADKVFEVAVNTTQLGVTGVVDACQVK
ncbi:MAG: DUF4307 domain-containing protein [Microbacteriaceae bacterium]